MNVLKSFDILSTAKIAGLLYLVVGIVEAVIIFVFSGIFSALLGSTSGITAGAAGLVTTPLIALVVGFFGVAIFAWIYNIFAGRFGGIKLILEKNELKRIDPVSAGKLVAIISAVVFFVMGLVLGAIFAVVAGGFGILIAIVFIIVYPIIGAICGFVGTAIAALIYNFVAFRIGGIMLYFKKDELHSVGVLSYAKIEAVFGALAGLVYGAIFTLLFYFINAMVSTAQVTSTAAATAMPHLITELGPFSIIIFPIVLAIISFVAALFSGFVYNKLAERVGGARLDIQKS